MSRINHTRGKNNSHKRATISNVYASTPIVNRSKGKQLSISLSEIDTGSSSSGGKITNNLQLLQDLTNKHRRYTKGKKRDAKWRMKDSDSEWEAKRKKLIDQSLNEKRKKKLKNKTKAIKKKQTVIQSKGTESEWETKSEKSIDEFPLDSQESNLKNDESIKLFEDPCTPEKTRDAPRTYEEILPESPIIRSSRRKLHLISKKNNITLENELLPVNLLSSEIRNPEEASKDEAIFDYEGNAETQILLPKLEMSSKQKPENTSSPDLQFRRDQSVRTHSRKTSQHSESSFELSPIKLTVRRLPKICRKTENISSSSRMTYVTRYWNKIDLKWEKYSDSSQEELKNGKRKQTKTKSKRNTKTKRKIVGSRRSRGFTSKLRYGVYDRYDKTDNEFETGGQDGKRMTFREFCQRKELLKNNEIVEISS